MIVKPLYITKSKAVFDINKINDILKFRQPSVMGIRVR